MKQGDITASAWLQAWKEERVYLFYLLRKYPDGKYSSVQGRIYLLNKMKRRAMAITKQETKQCPAP